MNEMKNDSEIKGEDGAAIVFGVINLVLVALFFLIKKLFLGASVALFFLFGFYAVFLAIKNGIKEKNMKCLGMGILGLILHLAAIGLMVLTIISIFAV